MKNNRNERKKKIKDLIYDKHYRPMKQKEIGYLMQVAPEDRPEFVSLLQELVEEGSIEVTKRGKYKPIEKEVLTGVFTCTKNGYGFVTVEGRDEDYYIHEKNINGAFHEDKVLIETIDGQQRSGHHTEARIIKILERGMKTIVGTLEKNQNFGFVVPDNQRFDSDIFPSSTSTSRTSFRSSLCSRGIWSTIAISFIFIGTYISSLMKSSITFFLFSNV